MSTLQSEIADLWNRYDDGLTADNATDDDLATLDVFLEELEAGNVRSAEKTGDDVTSWKANAWVKQGILLNFGLRHTEARSYGGVDYHDVLPLRQTADLNDRGTRNTPDGTTIRRGAYLGEDCIMMSPSFVNIGAYVGDGTLVDSCDTVGSCAQLGENVKLGANTLIGGVLEPVEGAPVIIEDGVSLGAGCRVTSGFKIGENSIVGENTLLTPRIPRLRSRRGGGHLRPSPLRASGVHPLRRILGQRPRDVRRRSVQASGCRHGCRRGDARSDPARGRAAGVVTNYCFAAER